jgi:hypothetical protein
LPLVTQNRLLRSDGNRVGATDPLSVDVVLRAVPAIEPQMMLTLQDWRSDDHPVRVAVLSSGVTLSTTSSGQLDTKRGVISGVSIDRSRALTVRFHP